ncbi:MAG: hypothetical protein KO202_07740 [Methanobacteriaceae archaeon]|jgi:hypothetical protein|nr:hypothetical protein [Methanobacteriaceae archaeon]
MGFMDDFKEWSTAKKAISIIAVCCVGLIIVFGIIGALSPDANTQTTNNSNNEDNSVETNSNNEDNSVETNSQQEKYTDGTYKVGSDIPAGEYKFTQTDEFGGYIERASDSSMDFDSIISNDATTDKGTTMYVTVNEGEYLKVQGGELTPA